MSESSEVGARARGWELVAALFGSLLVLPVAFLYGALGAADYGEVHPSTSDLVLVAAAVAVPLVAWGFVVVVLVYLWRGGWRRLWSLPLVISVGGLFVLSLLFLISSSIRESVLPYKPPPPKTVTRKGPGVIGRSAARAPE